MAQNQSQVQEQILEQKLSQSITQQQLLHAQLVELPVTQLAERVNAEMDDNPALEVMQPDDEEEWGGGSEDETTALEEDYDTTREREERQSALDEALASIGRDDEELPVYQNGTTQVDGMREEIVYGDSLSFYDQLNEQITDTEAQDPAEAITEMVWAQYCYNAALRIGTQILSQSLIDYLG